MTDATIRQQFRICFHDGAGGGACFIDAKDEAAARAFFHQAFPRYVIVTIRLEPVSPCAAYERRTT